MSHAATIPATRVLRTLVLALVLVAAPAVGLAYSRDGDKEDDAAEVEKQLDLINKKLMDMQNEEFDLTMKISQAQQKAQQGLEEPGKASQHLAEGKRSSALMKYKAVLVASAQRVQQFDRRFLPLLRQVQALQKKQGKVSKPVQAMIDQTAARVEGKHRSNVEKMSRFYEQAAEWGPALRGFLQVYSMIPDKERDKNQDLIKTIGELYDKAGSPQRALTFYNKIFETKDPKQRYGDKKLAEKVADLNAKTGNAQKAVVIYRGLLDHTPNDQKHKGERDKILEKIKALTGR